MTRQTVLFTPGDERHMVQKALDGEADMVILDIEDAVAPDAKDTACETVVEILKDLTRTEIFVEVAVRINPLDTRGKRDLSLLVDASTEIEDIVLPKVRDVETINTLKKLMTAHGFEADIIPLIETPECIPYLFEIAEHPDVVAFEFGSEDFTTEIGGVDTAERDEILYARQKVVTAASAAGIDALDMAWPDFSDIEGLRHNAQQAVNMGYDGKSAIHPAQIEVINEVFTPNSEQVEWAERVVAEARRAEAENKVVFQLDGKMIDPPIINRAKDILTQTDK